MLSGCLYPPSCPPIHPPLPLSLRRVPWAASGSTRPASPSASLSREGGEGGGREAGGKGATPARCTAGQGSLKGNFNTTCVLQASIPNTHFPVLGQSHKAIPVAGKSYDSLLPAPQQAAPSSSSTGGGQTYSLVHFSFALSQLGTSAGGY